MNTRQTHRHTYTMYFAYECLYCARVAGNECKNKTEPIAMECNMRSGFTKVRRKLRVWCFYEYKLFYNGSPMRMKRLCFFCFCILTHFHSLPIKLRWNSKITDQAKQMNKSRFLDYAKVKHPFCTAVFANSSLTILFSYFDAAIYWLAHSKTQWNDWLRHSNYSSPHQHEHGMCYRNNLFTWGLWFLITLLRGFE